MDDARIRSLIAELDNLVPRNGALIRPGEFFTETDEPAMVGNRLGYLRLGIELLKIADLGLGLLFVAAFVLGLIKIACVVGRL